MEQLYNEVRTQVVLENIFKGGLLQFILSVLFMLVSSWVLLKVIHIVLNRFLKRNKLDETNFLFIYRIIKAIVYTILVFGIAVQIIPLSKIAISLLASSGVAVLIIGFAAQEAFSNIISGFLSPSSDLSRSVIWSTFPMKTSLVQSKTSPYVMWSSKHLKTIVSSCPTV